MFCKYWKIHYFLTWIIFWLILRIHWSLSTILETSRKSVWSNIFWYVKVCIFLKCIQYTIHWEKEQILKKFHSDKLGSTKNVLFFLSGAPTRHSFTLICHLYMSRNKRFDCLKLCVGISIVDSTLSLLQFIFLFNQMHELFDFKASLLLSKLK